MNYRKLDEAFPSPKNHQKVDTHVVYTPGNKVKTKLAVQVYRNRYDVPISLKTKGIVFGLMNVVEWTKK